MYASIVANQGLPSIIEYPTMFDLILKTMKSIGYSHESTSTSTSSTTPYGIMIDLSTSWRTILVGLTPIHPIFGHGIITHYINSSS